MSRSLAGLFARNRRNSILDRSVAYACEPLERRVMLVDLEINGTSGPDVIVLQSANGTSISYTFNGTSFTAPDSAFSRILIFGHEGNDSIRVVGNGDNFTIIIGGLNDDTVSLGAELGSLNFIQSLVEVSDNLGNDTLTLNDASNPALHNYTITNTQVLRTGFPGVSYSSVDVITLNAGSVGNTIDILNPNALVSSVNVNAGGGDDVIRLAAGSGDLNLVPSNVTVDGQAGSLDSVLLFDSTFTINDTYTITSTTFDRTGAFGLLTYSGVEAMTLHAAQGNNFINVNSTFNGTLRINANGGGDTINVMDNFIGTQVVLDGGIGLDVVNVNTDNLGLASVRFEVTQDLSSLTMGTGGFATLSAGGAKVLRTNLLTQTGSGSLNLTDNNMIVDYSGASPLTAIRTSLTSCYAGGAWNGNGINSSTAAATPNRALGYAESSAIFSTFPAVFAGQQVDNTTVLVRYTRYGDADLNQIVNLNDFNRLAGSFGQSNTLWSQGNFNYDNVTNLPDFNLLAGNFGLNAAPDDQTDEALEELN